MPSSSYTTPHPPVAQWGLGPPTPDRWGQGAPTPERFDAGGVPRASGARPECPKRAAEADEAVCNVTHTPRLRSRGEPWLRWTFQVHRRRVHSHEHDPQFRVAAAAGLR